MVSRSPFSKELVVLTALVSVGCSNQLNDFTRAFAPNVEVSNSPEADSMPLGGGMIATSVMDSSAGVVATAGIEMLPGGADPMSAGQMMVGGHPDSIDGGAAAGVPADAGSSMTGGMIETAGQDAPMAGQPQASGDRESNVAGSVDAPSGGRDAETQTTECAAIIDCIETVCLTRLGTQQQACLMECETGHSQDALDRHNALTDCARRVCATGDPDERSDCLARECPEQLAACLGASAEDSPSGGAESPLAGDMGLSGGIEPPTNGGTTPDAGGDDVSSGGGGSEDSGGSGGQEQQDQGVVAIDTLAPFSAVAGLTIDITLSGSNLTQGINLQSDAFLDSAAEPTMTSSNQNRYRVILTHEPGTYDVSVFNWSDPDWFGTPAIATFSMVVTGETMPQPSSEGVNSLQVGRASAQEQSLYVVAASGADLALGQQDYSSDEAGPVGLAWHTWPNDDGQSPWQLQPVEPSDTHFRPASGDRFGASVAIGAGLMAIGAPGSSMVYLQSRTPEETSFTYRGRVQSSRAVNEQFGAALAMGDDYLVVGAPQRNQQVDAQPTATGGISLYPLSGLVNGTPSEVLVWPGVVSNEQASMALFDGMEFGTSVAIRSADTCTHDGACPMMMVVGAPGHNDDDSSRAIVLTLNRGLQDFYPFEQLVLLNPRTDSLNGFGSSVAINDSVVLVGAPSANNGDGSVFVFDHDGQYLQEIKGYQEPGHQSAFGTSVAMEGDFAVIGAPDDPMTGHSSRGSVYVLFQNQTTSRLAIVEKKQSPGTGQADSSDGVQTDFNRFGQSVSLSGRQGFTVDNSGELYRFLLCENDGEVTDLCAEQGFMLPQANHGDDGTGDDNDNGQSTTPLPEGPVTVIGEERPDANSTGINALGVGFDSIAGASDPLFVVAASGPDVVLGQKNYDSSGQVGSAWYIRPGVSDPGASDPGPTWVRMALSHEGTTLSDGAEFGAAVAIGTHYLAVGAPGMNKVFLQSRDNFDQHFEHPQILNPSTDEAVGFGTALAMDGQWLAIGAPSQSTHGAISLVPLSSQVEETSIINVVPDLTGETNMAFGSALAVWSLANEAGGARGPLTVAVGAPGVRRVIVLEQNANSTSLSASALRQTQIMAPAPPQPDGFGTSVAINDHVMLVGAPNANDGNGLVYVYQRNDISVELGWDLVQEIAPEEGVLGSRFGESIFMEGDFAVVGAPNESFGTDALRGSVSVLYRNPNTGLMAIVDKKRSPATPDASGSQTRHGFGRSVNISTREATTIDDRGEVYRFMLCEENGQSLQLCVAQGFELPDHNGGTGPLPDGGDGQPPPVIAPRNVGDFDCLGESEGQQLNQFFATGAEVTTMTLPDGHLAEGICLADCRELPDCMGIHLRPSGAESMMECAQYLNVDLALSDAVLDGGEAPGTVCVRRSESNPVVATAVPNTSVVTSGIDAALAFHKNVVALGLPGAETGVAGLFTLPNGNGAQNTNSGQTGTGQQISTVGDEYPNGASPECQTGPSDSRPDYCRAHFAGSVSIDDNFVWIGSRFAMKESTPPPSGDLRLYSHGGEFRGSLSSWSVQDELMTALTNEYGADPSVDPAKLAEFGASIATSGGMAVIGAPGSGYATPEHSGLAFVLSLSCKCETAGGDPEVCEIEDPTCDLTEDLLVSYETLHPGEGGEESRFGEAVAMSNNTVAVSAPDFDTEQVTSGRIEIFESNGDGQSWTRVQTAVSVADLGDIGNFGRALAMSPDVILVGSPGPSGGVQRVYFLVRSGHGSWSESPDSFVVNQPSRPTGEPDIEPYVGHDLDIDGHLAAVGAPGEEAVYIFGRSGTGAETQWQQLLRIVGPEDIRDASLGFGTQVEIEGRKVLVTVANAGVDQSVLYEVDLCPHIGLLTQYIGCQ